MKKLLTILMLCFAVFAAKAQVTVILEAHDVWEDGSGYQLLLDANATAYGTIFNEVDGFGVDGDVPDATYAEFEYKIPANADGVLTTTNIVFDGQLTITIPAGTYDFCVTNPSPDYETMYIASGEYGMKDDFVFQDGYVYHFKVEMDGDYDNVTLESYEVPTEPSMVISSTEMDYGVTLAGTTSMLQSPVFAYNLDTVITVTTEAPFAVSLDGTAFSDSLTMPAVGGTLYVQYAPAQAGTHTGMVTLVSGELTETITLAGEAVECNTITEFPYQTDFSDPVKNLCWTIEDVDEDGYTFTMSEEYGYASTYTYGVEADDWLISPEFTLTGQGVVSFDYGAMYSTYFPETFEVYLIQGETRTQIGNAIAPNNNLYTGDPMYRLAINLTDSVGTYQFGFHCTSENGYGLYITNFTVTDGAFLSVDPDTVNLDPVLVADADTTKDYAVVYTLNVTDSVVVTTEAPFLVSLDDSIYSTSVVIPASTELVGFTPVYVAFAPDAAGLYSGMVTFTAGTLADTVILTGEGVECHTIAEFPYQTDFTDEVDNLCWTIENANEDDRTFAISTNGYAYYQWNTESSADDWLISPELALTGNEYVSFDYYVRTAGTSERFEVYVIQDTTYTRIMDTISVDNTAPETKAIDLRAFEGIYKIAIHCVSDTDQYTFYVTNFLVATATQDMSVNPESIDFGIVIVDEYAQETVTLSLLNIADTVTVTTAEPFTISLNDTAYSTSLVIPATEEFAVNIPVYVKYAPDTTGEDNGMITFYVRAHTALGDTTLTDTVMLTGEGFECNTVAEFPYFTDFTEMTKNLCWTIEDANNDGEMLEIDEEEGYVSYGYDSDNNADEWLTSPEFTLTGAEYVAFDYYVEGSVYPEKFSVHLLQDTLDAVLQPTFTCTNEEALTMTLSLEGYTGDYRIAIHVTSDADMYGIYFTNFIVDSLDNLEASLVANPDTIDFGTVIFAENITVPATALVASVLVSDSLTVTTAAPFAVSLDGRTYASSVVIPAATTINTSLYVQYAPAAPGTHTGTVTVSGDTLTASIVLIGKAADCSGVATLPFTEDFEDELTDCWQNIDNDEDGIGWLFAFGDEELEQYAHTGSGFAASMSYYPYTEYYGIDLEPDNWLISPAITIPAAGARISWWDGSIHPTSFAEHYELMVSTTNTELTSFTSVFEMTLTANTWTQRTVDLAQYAGQTVYFAFVHNDCSGEYMLLLDDINVEEPTGIEEETAENPVVIYPNPASTMLNVHAENYRTVQIVNFLGQVVYSANVTENDFQINVSDLSNGVYFIRLNGETSTTQKFIKR